MIHNTNIISFFSSYLHGSGVSTLALSTAIIISEITEKRTLLINLDSKRSMLEKYIQNDIEIKQSIDDIKIYRENLNIHIIENYADIINDNFYIISKSEEQAMSIEFLDKLIEVCKGEFDFIILDLGNELTEIAKYIFEKTDKAFYVSKYNLLLWKEAEFEISDYIRNNKTNMVFNMFPNELSPNMTIDRFKANNKINNNIYVVYNDLNVFTEACENMSLYSFIIKNLESENIFIKAVYEMIIKMFEDIKIKNYKKPERKGLIKGWKLKIF